MLTPLFFVHFYDYLYYILLLLSKQIIEKMFENWQLIYYFVFCKNSQMKYSLHTFLKLTKYFVIDI